MRVMVVDDEPMLLRAFSRMLRQVPGMEVVTAGSATDALELARSEHVDVALSDVMMPVHDGRWLVEQLAADPCTAHVRCVLMTGLFDQEASVPEGVPLLVKPFSLEQLVEAIDRDS